jgi:glutamine synthetase
VTPTPSIEAGAPYQLSTVARQFIAGILRHGAEITAVTNQWVNSYKRIWGGGEAPAHLTWGHNNTSAMVRVPMYKPLKGQSSRSKSAPSTRLQPLSRVCRDCSPPA